MRVKRGVTARKRHKKLLKQTKGMSRARRTSSRLARQAVTKSLSYAYRDRRTRKRDLRRLWIIRINAAARESGTSYSQLAGQLKTANIKLDRKILAELAVNYPKVFADIAQAAQKPAPKLATQAKTKTPTKA